MNALGARGGIVEITVGSGAAEVVTPPEFAGQYPVLPSPARGTKYRAAAGKMVENQGEKRVQLVTDTGDLIKMTFQITDVNKPLASVGRITSKKNKVVLDDEDSYILHKPTGKKIKLYKKKNVFVMKVRIANLTVKSRAPKSDANDDRMDVDAVSDKLNITSSGTASKSDFGRHGM